MSSAQEVPARAFIFTKQRIIYQPGAVVLREAARRVFWI
jgi:hypothetical protein